MMKTTIAAALALALAAGSAMAEFKDFTVNGELVTKAQQEQVAAEALANNPNANQMIASPGFEDQVKQMVTEYKVMAKYARDKGIDKQDAVKEEVATMTDMILMKHAVNAIEEGIPSSLKDMVSDLSELTAKHIAEAYKQGDSLAEKLMSQMIYYSALHIYNLFIAFNINCYVCGGGLTNMGDFFLERIQEEADRLNKQENQQIYIKKAALGGDNGLLGCGIALDLTLRK